MTWNPITGCDRISPGCDNCYALRMAKRLRAMGAAKYQTDGDPRTSGPGFGVAVHADVMTEPLRWRSPRKVFVNSMSDIAHAHVSDTDIARIFAVMAVARQHQFQVLTKRPRRLAKLLARADFRDLMAQSMLFDDGNSGDDIGDWLAVNAPWPLPNVWLGTSIESDKFCWRADELRRTPTAVRFLSCEPLLGPLPSLDLAGIDWVIVGGESGPGFRSLNLDWARGIRDLCGAHSVALFFKQIGGLRPKSGGREIDGRTWDEYPATAAVVGRHG
ncbi:phage Gp37/Gp68 family protein [Nocardia sp. IFM 10818]